MRRRCGGVRRMAGREEELPRDLQNLKEGKAVDFIVATSDQAPAHVTRCFAKSRRFWLGAGWMHTLAPTLTFKAVGDSALKRTLQERGRGGII